MSTSKPKNRTEEHSDRAVKVRQLPTLRGVLKRALWTAVIAVVLVALIDTSMIVVAHLRVTDNANTAAFAGAAAAANKPIDVDTARIAFAAAQAQAQADGGNALAGSFSLHSDGSVTVTVVKTAPTIVAGRLPQTRKFTQLEATGTSKGPTL